MHHSNMHYISGNIFRDYIHTNGPKLEEEIDTTVQQNFKLNRSVKQNIVQHQVHRNAY
jgi:hypothetical protein